MLDASGEPVMEKPRHIGSKPLPKLEYRGLIFHDLRRTCVTDEEHAGHLGTRLMKVTGHKTESVYKRYAIETREQRRAAVAQFDSYRAKQFGDDRRIPGAASTVSL